MADPTYPLFPICAFLGFFLSLIPLPWHLKAWNSGTCFFMTWSSLACLNQFVNSVVWHNNAINHAPVWCEISIRIMMGASVGIPVSSLCINRRLYRILTLKKTVITENDKRRTVLEDTLICVVYPLMHIALQYVVQGHRFNIYEDIGCFPAIYNTPLAYVISHMWPLLIGCISAFYCTMTLRAFFRHRIEFTKLLSTHSSVTLSRYFRLMGLAITELLCTMPLSILIICLNATGAPTSPWISLEDTHYNYSRIEQIAALLWRQNHSFSMGQEFTRWISLVCAFIFFAFFGFADEARKNYITLFCCISRHFQPQKTMQRPSSDINSVSSPPCSPNFVASTLAQKTCAIDIVKFPPTVYTSSSCGSSGVNSIRNPVLIACPIESGSHFVRDLESCTKAGTRTCPW